MRAAGAPEKTSFWGTWSDSEGRGPGGPLGWGGWSGDPGHIRECFQKVWGHKPYGATHFQASPDSLFLMNSWQTDVWHKKSTFCDVYA